MNLLVTGAGGYIGSTLCGNLLEAGHRVTALDIFRHGNSLARYCADPKFLPIKGDCRDNRVMKPLIEKADAIIPLAAIVGMGACENDQVAARTTNYEAVRMICDYASPEQMIAYPNTNSGYGIGEEECTEDSPLKPISFYGITKVEAETVVMQRQNSVAFRLATAFGASPRMRCDLLVNDLVHRAVHEKVIVLFEGHYRRNFIHVRDIATAFCTALWKWDQYKSRVYNVGDSRANLTKLQLCERIKAHIPELVYMEAKVGSDPDKRNYLVSNKRIENMGWMPGRSLDEGIVELRKLFCMLKDRVYVNA